MENQNAKVVIYTKDPCPYCVRAINFFNEYGIKYEEIDLSDKPEEIERIKTETGWRTVPIIMINNELIGGYSDMKNLHEEGKLEPKLKA
jgi:glutaredoxin 3